MIFILSVIFKKQIDFNLLNQNLIAITIFFYVFDKMCTKKKPKFILLQNQHDIDKLINIDKMIN